MRKSNKYLQKIEYHAARSSDARATSTASHGRDGRIDGSSPIVSSTKPDPLRVAGSGTETRSQVAANASSFRPSTSVEARFGRARNGIDQIRSDPSSISYRKPASSFAKLCFTPEGHVIVTAATSASPRPKCICLECCERYPLPRLRDRTRP